MQDKAIYMYKCHLCSIFVRDALLRKHFVHVHPDFSNLQQTLDDCSRKTIMARRLATSQVLNHEERNDHGDLSRNDCVKDTEISLNRSDNRVRVQKAPSGRVSFVRKPPRIKRTGSCDNSSSISSTKKKAWKQKTKNLLRYHKFGLLKSAHALQQAKDLRHRVLKRKQSRNSKRKVTTKECYVKLKKLTLPQRKVTIKECYVKLKKLDLPQRKVSLAMKKCCVKLAKLQLPHQFHKHYKKDARLLKDQQSSSCGGHNNTEEFVPNDEVIKDIIYEQVEHSMQVASLDASPEVHYQLQEQNMCMSIESVTNVSSSQANKTGFRFSLKDRCIDNSTVLHPPKAKDQDVNENMRLNLEAIESRLAKELETAANLVKLNSRLRSEIEHHRKQLQLEDEDEEKYVIVLPKSELILIQTLLKSLE